MTNRDVSAALDLACLMRRLLDRRPRLTQRECNEVRRLVLRNLASLHGTPLRPAETLDEETAKAALTVVLKALTDEGFTNLQLVTWFNDTAIERTH